MAKSYHIILFYKYYPFAKEEVSMLVEDCKSYCNERRILGRLLVACEGINGTLAGSPADIASFIAYFEMTVQIGPIDWKYSCGEADELPFLTLSVREAKELIGSGNERNFINRHIEYDPACFGGLKGTGKHLTPKEFHHGIQREDSLVLDIRNEFEYNIGHFTASKNLKTFTYAETWKSLETILKEENIDGDIKSRPIFMYCTGGIRCEKASAYLVGKGFENVCQLQGGIHRYLEEYPDGGLFQGRNFVFDSRVSVASSQSHADSQKGVGRCIDCDMLYDRFSGHVVCTVCRTPVLVCKTCIADNPYPEEYYCSRHRVFKNIYFTVLERFTNDDLEKQVTQLKELFCSFDSPSDRHRRRTITKQISRINELLRVRESVQEVTELTNPKTRGGWGFWKS